MKNKIQLFQEQKVRTHWNEEKEKWFFSIVDVLAIFTEKKDHQVAINYWKVLKHRLVKEGNKTVTNCNRLKMIKIYQTDIIRKYKRFYPCLSVKIRELY